MAKSSSRKSKKDKSTEQADGHLPGRENNPHSFGTEKDVMALQRAAGNQAVSRLLQSDTEIAVSQPGDAREREASRIADDAVRKSGPITPLSGSGSKQSGKTPAKKSAPAPGRDSPIKKAGSRGQPLSESDRTFFESRLGHDLSDARIHTDAHTAEQADALNARAFTVGQDIGFGAGEYAPQTTGGKRLLAHELTHVVQQQNLSSGEATGAADSGTVMRAPKRRDLKLRAPKLGESRHPIEPPSLLGSEIPKPIVTRAAGGIHATLYFGQDSFFLDSANYKAVEKLSEELRFMFKPSVIVDGYASGEGEERYNLDLSEKRRQLVIAILGVESTGKAYGESKPAVEEPAPKGGPELEKRRALDRRVEVTIVPHRFGLVKPPAPDFKRKPIPPSTFDTMLKDPRMRRIAEDLSKKGSLSDFDLDKAADRVLEEGIGIKSEAGREVIKGVLRHLIEERRPGITLEFEF